MRSRVREPQYGHIFLKVSRIINVKSPGRIGKDRRQLCLYDSRLRSLSGSRGKPDFTIRVSLMRAGGKEESCQDRFVKNDRCLMGNRVVNPATPD